MKAKLRTNAIQIDHRLHAAVDRKILPRPNSAWRPVNPARHASVPHAECRFAFVGQIVLFAQPGAAGVKVRRIRAPKTRGFQHEPLMNRLPRPAVYCQRLPVSRNPLPFGIVNRRFQLDAALLHFVVYQRGFHNDCGAVPVGLRRGYAPPTKRLTSR